MPTIDALANLLTICRSQDRGCVRLLSIGPPEQP
jgi:hypothetical protein